MIDNDKVYEVFELLVENEVFGEQGQADAIVNAGYRKADEVRKETIKEVSKWLHDNSTFLDRMLAENFDKTFNVEADK